MEIKIGRTKYRIELDPHCWVLQYKLKQPVKDGREWANLGYYSDLHCLAKTLVKMGLKHQFFLDNGVKTLNQVTREVGNALVASLERQGEAIDMGVIP